MQAIAFLPRMAVLVAIIILGQLTAGALSGTAQAKTFETCKWFGTAPICSGSCPGGWAQRSRSGKGCMTGSKAHCCKSECIPDRPAKGWNPNAERDEPAPGFKIVRKCQVCTKWGDACGSGNRFQTVCLSYRWAACGKPPVVR